MNSDMGAGGKHGRSFFNPVKLEADGKLFEKNLRISDDAQSNTLTIPDSANLFSLPSLSVTPETGLCVKTLNIGGVKVFVNVCCIEEIPAPPHDMSEDRLKGLMAEENYEDCAKYRVPMSLGGPRSDKDNAGKECIVCDVAVNTTWFKDVMKESIVFTTFVIIVSFEGLHDKYGEQCNLDRQNWTILKHKKYMGPKQLHNIQKRDSTQSNDRAKIKSEMQEGDQIKIYENSEDMFMKSVKTVRYNRKSEIKLKNQLKFKLWKSKSHLFAYITFPETILDGKFLNLTIGANRVHIVYFLKKDIVDTKNDYTKEEERVFDVRLPCSVDYMNEENHCAEFDCVEHVLTVKMLLKS